METKTFESQRELLEEIQRTVASAKWELYRESDGFDELEAVNEARENALEARVYINQFLTWCNNFIDREEKTKDAKQKLEDLEKDVVNRLNTVLIREISHILFEALKAVNDGAKVEDDKSKGIKFEDIYFGEI